MTSRRRDTAAGEVVERQLPHNLEAERAVLGAIMLHNDAYERVAKTIAPEDFFRDAHRRIFKSIERLLEHPGGRVDMVTLKEELARRGDLDEVGGPAYISAMIDGVPRGTNVEHYAGIVREKATLCRLIYASNRVLTAAYAAEESASSIVTMADRQIVDIQSSAIGGNMQSLAKTHNAYCATLDERVANKGALTGLETGFKFVNQITMGWQRKDTILLAARPSIGKTAFVLNTARAIAESCRPKSSDLCHVAFFSLEMRRDLLEDRLLASLTGIPSTLIRSGYIIGEESNEALVAGLTRMREINIHIDDTKGRNVFEIRAECRRLKSEYGLDAVIIDYVQLMAGSLERRGATRTEELSDISRRLNIMFGELDVAGLVLSQLSRASENRPDPRPKLSDLRESGALEQDADLVGFLHRKNHKDDGLTQFIVEKARNGPTGTINLMLQRDVTLFTDYEGAEPVPEPVTTPEEKKAAQVSFFRQRARR